MDLQVGQIIHFTRPEANNANDRANCGARIARAGHGANSISDRLNGSRQDGKEHGACRAGLHSNFSTFFLFLVFITAILGSSYREVEDEPARESLERTEGLLVFYLRLHRGAFC
jgi:hypothetical protein